MQSQGCVLCLSVNTPPYPPNNRDSVFLHQGMCCFITELANKIVIIPRYAVVMLSRRV